MKNKNERHYSQRDKSAIRKQKNILTISQTKTIERETIEIEG